MSRHQRDHAVSEGAKSVHPRGSPISHSTKFGLRERGPESPGKTGPVARGAWRPSRQFVATSIVGSAPSLWSREVGVAH